jgi:hypothetical protein
MKTRIVLALLAILAFAISPTRAEERPCRPSLSNFYHCPDTSAPQAKQRRESNTRPCRPSLSNGYSCPGTSSEDRGRTTSAPERGCVPSLSNAFNCPGQAQTQTGANQYSTEALAWAHCPTDTVVWANTRSDIYHFRGTHNYGNTKAGAYMCERDALGAGIRAAKNEKHP